MNDAAGKDLVTTFTEATDEQERAFAIMGRCAEIRISVVRRLRADGMSQLAIANLLGTSQSTVWRLLHGRL